MIMCTLSRRPISFVVFGLLMLILCFGCGGAQTDSPVLRVGPRRYRDHRRLNRRMNYRSHVWPPAAHGLMAGVSGPHPRRRPRTSANQLRPRVPVVSPLRRRQSRGGTTMGRIATRQRTDRLGLARLPGCVCLISRACRRRRLKRMPREHRALWRIGQSDVLVVIYPVGSYIADVSPGTWSPDGNPERGSPSLSE